MLLERRELKQLGDVPLPSGEALVEVKRFSLETRQALEKEGYLIYQLTGQSIKSLREAGRKFWSAWHKDYPDFEALTSKLTEVAINPKTLFLPDSNRKTLKEQEKMVKEFSQNLSRKIKGAEAIIGETPDYVELAFRHLDATGNYLFGKEYSYNCTRTKTLTVGSFVALVGYFFGPRRGLYVYRCFRDAGRDCIWGAPLVVPQ